MEKHHSARPTGLQRVIKKSGSLTYDDAIETGNDISFIIEEVEVFEMQSVRANHLTLDRNHAGISDQLTSRNTAAIKYNVVTTGQKLTERERETEKERERERERERETDKETDRETGRCTKRID